MRTLTTATPARTRLTRIIVVTSSTSSPQCRRQDSRCIFNKIKSLRPLLNHPIMDFQLVTRTTVPSSVVQGTTTSTTATTADSPTTGHLLVGGQDEGRFLAINRILLQASGGAKNGVKPTQIRQQGFDEPPVAEVGQRLLLLVIVLVKIVGLIRRPKLVKKTPTTEADCLEHPATSRH